MLSLIRFPSAAGMLSYSSPRHAVTNSPTSERGTWAETRSGPPEDPGLTTTGKGGGVATRPSLAPGSTFSPPFDAPKLGDECAEHVPTTNATHVVLTKRR